LKKYTPTHPYFFKLINKLNDKSLNKKQLYLLRVNIERLKLLKDYKSNSFIQLNIPSYDFKFYENSKLIKSFGTVIGAYSSQTPILSSKLSHFIINPTWNIPDSIAASSVIPKSLKDKNYLKKKNIVIRKNYNLSSKEYKFEDINWKKYLKKNVRYIPYKFIQLPSSSNGMGRVKFLFKNSYAVYMHDTIGSWRFKINKEKIRVISHGCIRLEHPLSLVKHISTNYTRKSYRSVKRSYDKELTKTISLSKYLPIHITYLTVVIKNNKLFFYKDIYLYDKIQKLNFNN
ncbi:MAG: L,D-transpeptidase family protein, partial [Campylobacteraceae bacterium]|nr:L,D-transpeptidase family protein [Campylobacteraceae bacterium]